VLIEADRQTEEAPGTATRKAKNRSMVQPLMASAPKLREGCQQSGDPLGPWRSFTPFFAYRSEGTREGIVNLGNLLTVSPPRTTANLLVCGPGVGRARLKIVEIGLNFTMPFEVKVTDVIGVAAKAAITITYFGR